MNKKLLVILALAVVIFLSTYILLFRKSGNKLPNIIIVTCDTLRADRLHLYGNPRETSPNLDALAKESVVFEQFYSNSSFTPPSHGSILTGRYVTSHGVLWWDSTLPPTVQTVAELVATPKGGTVATGLGYKTGAFVNLENFRKLGLTRGFETVRSQTWFTGEELNKDFFDWIDATKDDTRPAMSWLHFWDPHRPYGYREYRWLKPPTVKSPAELASMPEVDRGIYERTAAAGERKEYLFNETLFGRGSLGVGRMEQHYDRLLANKNAPLIIPGEPASRPFTADDDRFLVDRFDGGVKYTDECLGKLIDGLRERGILENTILVITADHGESFTEHEEMLFAHDPHLYDEVTRVPCIIRFPNAQFGGARVSGTVAESVDLLPTIWQSIGVLPNAQFQGRSLLPAIDGSAANFYAYSQTQTKVENRTTKKFELSGRKYSIRSKTHRLIGEPLPDKHWKFEYYNLIDDPRSQKNLHSEPPSSDELKLRSDLMKWITELPVPPAGERALTDAELNGLITGGYIGKGK